MVKRRKKKRVTTVKKINYNNFLDSPSAWAFIVAIGFFIVALLIWAIIPGIKSLYGFTVACMIIFIGLGIAGGIKELVKKTYDYSYLSVGALAVSFLSLVISSMTSELFSIYFALLASIGSVILAVLGIIQSAKEKKGSTKIFMDSFLILGSLAISIFLVIGIVLANVFRHGGNFTGW